MVKLLQLFICGPAFFFFITASTTAESSHVKISSFINSTTAAIFINDENASSGDTVASSPRRVWITYSKGSHGSVLNNMEIHCASSSSLTPMYDFPAVHGIVTMASEAEIALLMANASSGVINITEDPMRYPLTQRSISPPVRSVRKSNLQQYWEGQYGIFLTQVDQLRATTGLDGAGVTVCVIDSGLDATHEDFNTTGYSGESLIPGNEWFRDLYGHGTHVSGIIAAADNAFGVMGVAPRVTIYTVDIFDDLGNSYASAVVDAVYKCRDAGAKIINLSLGGLTFFEPENTVFRELYDYYGILSVAAAGNGGSNEYSFPASYDNVLSVGAVDSSKNLAVFSQYNDKVNLVAPGVAIWSTLPSNDCKICSEKGYTTYGLLDGTSTATPFVSGIAALLMSYNPKWSVETIKNALLDSAEDLGISGRDVLYGYGLVSAVNAFNLLTSSMGVKAPPTTEPPISYPGATIPPSSCAKATLFFRTDDYPYESFVSLYDFFYDDYLWLSSADLADTDYSLESRCLDVNGCYEFKIFDTGGDGLCCKYGTGFFQLTFNGYLVASGDAIGFGAKYLFGGGC